MAASWPFDPTKPGDVLEFLACRHMMSYVNGKEDDQLE